MAPWNFSPTDIRAPLYLLHGNQDRIVPSTHSQWLAKHIPHAELHLTPTDGHISILHQAPTALTWLTTHSRTP